MIFVDIIGSTQLVTGRPATEVVELLNRFFAVIVEEVDRHHGFVNKFEGDAALAVFGAPNHLEQSRGRGAGRRTCDGPAHPRGSARMRSRHRRGAGQAVAGNVGARERFEYTVIGEPVNEAARLCELAKDSAQPPARVVGHRVQCHRRRAGHWSLGDTVTLRGHDEPTRLAVPV